MFGKLDIIVPVVAFAVVAALLSTVYVYKQQRDSLNLELQVVKEQLATCNKQLKVVSATGDMAIRFNQERCERLRQYYENLPKAPADSSPGDSGIRLLPQEK